MITGMKNNDRNKYLKDSLKKFDILSTQGMYNIKIIHKVISSFYGIKYRQNLYYKKILFEYILKKKGFLHSFMCPLFFKLYNLHKKYQ